MKTEFSANQLPDSAVLLTCSSHEDRCKGVLRRLEKWRASEAVIFHYDDSNPKREANHSEMEAMLDGQRLKPTSLQFTERNAVKSIHDNLRALRSVLRRRNIDQIVLDISVFTKRHLLMMLRWLDDENQWDRLWIVYSEPQDYDVSEFIPLSFGLATLQQIPGFSASPDLSRPLHLVLFLGYEGDRALAVYEHLQPIQTTLMIPSPPYRPGWAGRTERLNADLITVVGERSIVNVDSIDPDQTHSALVGILGDGTKHSQHSRMICPLGTKPQTLGIYNYVRACTDPPAMIYASPLRHNHNFFSRGIGPIWILKKGLH